MAVSEAKKRANKKWNDANYKRINLAIPIDEYQIIDNHCNNNNISKNSFILGLIRNKLNIKPKEK